jgi:hypothetical protein
MRREQRGALLFIRYWIFHVVLPPFSDEGSAVSSPHRVAHSQGHIYPRTVSSKSVWRRKSLTMSSLPPCRNLRVRNTNLHTWSSPTYSPESQQLPRQHPPIALAAAPDEWTPCIHTLAPLVTARPPLSGRRTTRGRGEGGVPHLVRRRHVSRFSSDGTVRHHCHEEAIAGAWPV